MRAKSGMNAKSGTGAKFGAAFGVVALAATLAACQAPVEPTDTQLTLLEPAERAAARGDFDAAFARYLSLADNGVVVAMHEAATYYERGRGVEQNYADAAFWYGQAAEAGYGRSMRHLGILYERGDGVEQDDEKALSWYLRSAEAGDDFAAARAARYILDGRGGAARDAERALPLLRRAAESGSVGAQLDLAELYETGDQVPRDLDEAQRWYAAASANLFAEAEAGDVKAQRRLGDQFARGDGLPEDGRRAAIWYERAAAQNDLNSIVKLARLYNRGAANLSPDPASAARLYQIALTLGHEDSAFDLGRMYGDGRGVPRDGQRALALYDRAIANGDARAVERAGRIWADSRIEPTDFDRAARIFEVGATEFADPKSMYRLAELHERGRLAESDRALALMWYRLSADGGYQLAEGRVERLTARLSSAELRRARTAYENALSGGSRSALRSDDLE